MKIKFLLLGTSLSFLPTLSLAQCVATQDCATLGYTETSCNGGKGVKCPFGNKWACLISEEEVRNKLCQELGFTLTCTGTGYAGGAGSACGGKYVQCTCSSGYEWKGSSCKKESCSSSYKYTCTGIGYVAGSGIPCDGKYTQCDCKSGYEWKDGSCQKILNGAQGDLYYCNGSVAGVKTSGMNFYVAMKDLGTRTWSSANSSCQSYSFCGNLKGILPSKDQLLTMYKNKSSLNSLLLMNDGTELTEVYYWSSTRYDDRTSTSYRYIVNMFDGDSNWDSVSYYDNFHYVRPVLVDY